jgi:low temperature requirement protein LtrA
MPENDQQETHPLVEPRVVAAIGAVALGCGIGFGLMLAKQLILIGLVLSLMSAVAMLWIYWKYIAKSYQALKNKEIYDGVGVAELTVAIGIIIAIILLSVPIYVIESRPEPIINRAIFTFYGAHYETVSGKSDTFKDSICEY